jgi:hypothetical protein
MSVLVTAGGAGVATAVPAVVVSHGKNGQGAYTVAALGTQTAVGTDVDEQDNQLTGAGNTMVNLDFVYKPAIPSFDDEVAWIPPGVLFSRMIRAGKLP